MNIIPLFGLLTIVMGSVVGTKCTGNATVGPLFFAPIKVPCPSVGKKVAAMFRILMPNYPDTTIVTVSVFVAAAYGTHSNETAGITLTHDTNSNGKTTCRELFFHTPNTTDPFDKPGKTRGCRVFESPTKLCSKWDYGNDPKKEMTFHAVVSNWGGQCVGDILLEGAVDDIFLRVDNDIVKDPSRYEPTQCLAGLEEIVCGETNNAEPSGSGNTKEPSGGYGCGGILLAVFASILTALAIL